MMIPVLAKKKTKHKTGSYKPIYVYLNNNWHYYTSSSLILGESVKLSSEWGREGKASFDRRCNLIPEMLLYNMCLYVLYLLYPFTPILHLLGCTKNGSQPFFSFYFLLVFFFLSHIFVSFFNLTQCLWFDLHRHLFLLVLFLLCGCDYNQEMEIQKSTCCHSKYVLFHLLNTLLITRHPPHLCVWSVSLFFFAWLQ